MVTSKLATAEDLWNLPNDGFRYNLIRGEIRKLSPSRGEHGMVAARMALPLFQLLITDPAAGEVFIADCGFFLRDDPPSVVAPDAAFVRAEDLPPRSEWKRFMRCVPTLVIEVVSPSETISEIMDKVDEYLAAGVPLIWIAFPETKTVMVDGARRERVILSVDDTLDGGDVLPALPRTPVADVFR